MPAFVGYTSLVSIPPFPPTLHPIEIFGFASCLLLISILIPDRTDAHSISFIICPGLEEIVASANMSISDYFHASYQKKLCMKSRVEAIKS